MGLFDKLRGRRRKGGAAVTDPAADLRYLHQWVAEHEGVEAFIEPKTTVTELTVVLVAADGNGPGAGPAGTPAPGGSPTASRSPSTTSRRWAIRNACGITTRADASSASAPPARSSTADQQGTNQCRVVSAREYAAVRPGQRRRADRRLRRGQCERADARAGARTSRLPQRLGPRGGAAERPVQDRALRHPRGR